MVSIKKCSKRFSSNGTNVMTVISTILMSVVGDPQGLNFGEYVGREITKGIVAVKVPIEETVVYVGSSQCSNVKKIVGVDYEQYKEGDEPDLNKLTLNFISSSIRITYNLTDAAKLIPQSREFNPNKSLVIFIHGFTDDPTQESFKAVNEAFTAIGHSNILALDASSLIQWMYLRSTTYIRFIGTRLGEVLAAMVKSGTDPKAIHLVGHSLGSHISSFAGKRFAELTGARVGRISGLDPAGPCFSHVDPDLRLKASDADFVDAMHTDAGVYGLKDSVGHVDYHPNGGSQQPNCLFQTCSHSRAWIYFAESVVHLKNFQAVACKDWDAFRKGICEKDVKIMGYGCSPDTRGNYYLQTNEDSPYGKGVDGVTFVNNEGIVRNLQTYGASLLQ